MPRLVTVLVADEPQPTALVCAANVPSEVEDIAQAPHGEAAMYRLSKRLWAIEIHRRLERDARHATGIASA